VLRWVFDIGISTLLHVETEFYTSVPFETP
jgi:hypothetical protein